VSVPGGCGAVVGAASPKSVTVKKDVDWVGYLLHNVDIQTKELVMPTAAKKWYVGDKYDNFSEHDTATEAGCQADGMIAEGLEGVYILHLTSAQFEQFCITGKHTVGEM